MNNTLQYDNIYEANNEDELLISSKIKHEPESNYSNTATAWTVPIPQDQSSSSYVPVYATFGDNSESSSGDDSEDEIFEFESDDEENELHSAAQAAILTPQVPFHFMTPSTESAVPNLPPLLPSADKTFVFQSKPVDPPVLSFLSNQALKKRPQGNTPLDYFLLLLNDKILDVIIRETNEFADSLQRNRTMPNARIARWRPLTKNEFLVFLGITFHTGTFQARKLNTYFTPTNIRQGILHIPCFKDAMRYNRYLLILLVLNFVPNLHPDESIPTDKLYKIRPLIEFFNSVMDETISPGCEISINESIIPWRDRLSFRQFIRNKSNKHDMRLYMLAEPSGLVLQFLLYNGPRDKLKDNNHVDRIVMKLMENRTGLGHRLYMNNSYTSVELTKRLLDDETYVTGTLLKQRPNNPTTVIKQPLKKGEVVQQYTKEGICVMKWHYKRDLLMISSRHNGELVDVTSRRGTPSRKPEMVVAYNKYMGSIDHIDQHLSYYPCSSRNLKWYNRLAFHIFHILLINSHLIYQQYEKNINLHDFRLDVIERLMLLSYPLRPRQPIPKIVQQTGHWPTSTERCESGSRANRKKLLICRHCYSRGVKRTTSFYCVGCVDIQQKQIGLCPDCFKDYHNMLNS